MHPEHDATVELRAITGGDDEPSLLPALIDDPGIGEEEPRRRRSDRHARRSRPRGRRAAVMSAVAPLLVMSAVAAMAATETGPFDSRAAGHVVTASVIAPRAPEPTPEETERSAEPTPAAPAETPTVIPPPPPAVPAPYQVQPGDTMYAIEQHCGVPWRRIFDANPEIEDPSVLFTGLLVRCPAPDEQLAERPLPTVATRDEPSDDDPPPAEEDPPADDDPEPPPVVADGSVWDRLAECESGGNWSINTGNGYYGGLQFSLSSWRAVGGSGYPHENSRDEQIRRGELLQNAQGWGAWPTCARKLGLT